MSTVLPAHALHSTDDTGKDVAEIAWVYAASDESVKTVLEADPTSGDGRSEYVWIRFQNGDLALAVFPQGGTYFAVEEDAAQPGEAWAQS